MPEGIIIPNPLGSCGVYCEKKITWFTPTGSVTVMET